VTKQSPKPNRPGRKSDHQQKTNRKTARRGEDSCLLSDKRNKFSSPMQQSLMCILNLIEAADLLGRGAGRRSGKGRPERKHPMDLRSQPLWELDDSSSIPRTVPPAESEAGKKRKGNLRPLNCTQKIGLSQLLSAPAGNTLDSWGICA